MYGGKRVTVMWVELTCSDSLHHRPSPISWRRWRLLLMPSLSGPPDDHCNYMIIWCDVHYIFVIMCFNHPPLCYALLASGSAHAKLEARITFSVCTVPVTILGEKSPIWVQWEGSLRSPITWEAAMHSTSFIISNRCNWVQKSGRLTSIGCYILGQSVCACVTYAWIRQPTWKPN